MIFNSSEVKIKELLNKMFVKEYIRGWCGVGAPYRGGVHVYRLVELPFYQYQEFISDIYQIPMQVFFGSASGFITAGLISQFGVLASFMGMFFLFVCLIFFSTFLLEQFSQRPRCDIFVFSPHWTQKPVRLYIKLPS